MNTKEKTVTATTLIMTAAKAEMGHYEKVIGMFKKILATTTNEVDRYKVENDLQREQNYYNLAVDRYASAVHKHLIEMAEETTDEFKKFTFYYAAGNLAKAIDAWNQGLISPGKMANVAGVVAKFDHYANKN